MDAGMFLDLASNIGRTGFDYLLLGDSIYIGQNWQGRRDSMSTPRQEVGGDGFLITLPNASRRTVAEITDGLVRKQYGHKQFRDNLLEF